MSSKFLYRYSHAELVENRFFDLRKYSNDFAYSSRYNIIDTALSYFNLDCLTGRTFIIYLVKEK